LHQLGDDLAVRLRLAHLEQHRDCSRARARRARITAMMADDHHRHDQPRVVRARRVEVVDLERELEAGGQTSSTRRPGHDQHHLRHELRAELGAGRDRQAEPRIGPITRPTNRSMPVQSAPADPRGRSRAPRTGCSAEPAVDHETRSRPATIGRPRIRTTCRGRPNHAHVGRGRRRAAGRSAVVMAAVSVTSSPPGTEPDAGDCTPCSPSLRVERHPRAACGFRGRAIITSMSDGVRVNRSEPPW